MDDLAAEALRRLPGSVATQGILDVLSADDDRLYRDRDRRWRHRRRGQRGFGSDSSAAGLFASPLFILFIVFVLAMLVPSLAVQVRRFHDQDKSGWFVLLGLIPYIGGIVLIVFMCLEGTKGPNKFGPDPKNPEGDLTSVFR